MSNQISDKSYRMPNKYGEALKYDPTFNGPLKNRSCTDVLFLLIFIIFIIGWIVIAILGFINGNPQQIIFPTDTYGNICGRKNLENKKYLFFFNLFKCAKSFNKIFDRCDTPQVCVTQCPQQTFSLYPLSKESFEKYRDSIVCKYNIQPSYENIKQLIQEDQCAVIYMKSEPFGGRCIPSLLNMKGQKLIDDITNQSLLLEDNTNIDMQQMKGANKAIAVLLSAREIGAKIIQDLSHTWEFILVGLAFAMLVAFSWIVLMQWFAKIMIWLSIVILIALSGFGLYYCYTRYADMNGNSESNNATITENQYNFRDSMKSELDSYLANRKTWLIFSIACAVILVVLLIILLFLRNRIRLAIALIEEASQAVINVKSSLFFPLIPYVSQFIVICFWGGVTIMIVASARPKYHDANGRECDPNATIAANENNNSSCVFSQYYEDKIIFAAQVYNLFGLLWLLFFIVGIGQVSLAGAFASYYWSLRKPEDVEYFAVFGGLHRCLRYHIGSVALGSLLIATIRFIRLVLEYIDNKCKKYADNIVVKAILCLFKCFFWCLEKFLKFINKNAYIMIAIYGKNFCHSAGKGFYLIFRNAARAVVLDKVTDFLIIVGKLSVTSLVAVISFYVFSNRIDFVNVPDLNYYWVPIVIITFGTYLIVSCFFSVYDMAVDTLFLCFLEDCERNDGSEEKPYYMSKQLMKILGKKNSNSNSNLNSP